MRKFIALTVTAFLSCAQLQAQDTFSMLAIDTVTGEVGSAGGSCLDAIALQIADPSFLSELFPGHGGINTQAYHHSTNQVNARARMNLGDTPSQIIQWLVANDATNREDLRQYGVIAMVNGSPEGAAHDGSMIPDYKSHIIGPNYVIVGNFMSGQEIVDSMEAGFLNTPGDLACKLMGAMQGANVIGADTRCIPHKTSSLFAFLKVAQPTDRFRNPSFKIFVKIRDGDSIEPIDSLQTLFDLRHHCSGIGIKEGPKTDLLKIYPNPAEDVLNVEMGDSGVNTLEVHDLTGRSLYQSSFGRKTTIDLSTFKRGSYLLKVTNRENTFIRRVIRH